MVAGACVCVYVSVHGNVCTVNICILSKNNVKLPSDSYTWKVWQSTQIDDKWKMNQFTLIKLDEFSFLVSLPLC